MNNRVELYDSLNIDQLSWPKTQEGDYARRYIVPFVKNGTNYYIDNVHAKALALKIDEIILPVMVASEKNEECYVCSAFSYYISYAHDSLPQIIKNGFLRNMVEKALNSFGYFIKKGKIDSVVYVNNWLFSTDLYPKSLDPDKIKRISDFLKKQFPNRAITFRSINPLITNELQSNLKSNGFHLIATRQIYITDGTNESLFKTRIIKSDLKLWNESSYQMVDPKELNHQEREHLLSLYKKLYFEKHSALIPQFNHNFIHLAIDQELLQIKALVKGGLIEGVIGYFERDGTMMCPFFGYDKNNPESNTLYRLLSTSLLLEARNKGLKFNQGAGASFYKRTRRAEPCIEQIAVYLDHLPFKRRIPWLILKTLINSIGVVAMKKY